MYDYETICATITQQKRDIARISRMSQQAISIIILFCQYRAAAYYKICIIIALVTDQQIIITFIPFLQMILRHNFISIPDSVDIGKSHPVSWRKAGNFPEHILSAAANLEVPFYR